MVKNMSERLSIGHSQAAWQSCREEAWYCEQVNVVGGCYLCSRIGVTAEQAEVFAGRHPNLENSKGKGPN